jgi:hypothetical protein
MKNNIERTIEVKRLKSEIKTMLAEMGVSKNMFNRTIPKFNGSGFKYRIDAQGGKPSLRQRWKYLMDLKAFRAKKEKEELEKKDAK